MVTLLRLHPSHKPHRGNRPPLRVKQTTSGAIHSHGVTGGVYKARERIHRSNADLRLLAIPTSWSRVADSNPDYDALYEVRLLSRGRFSLYAPL